MTTSAVALPQVEELLRHYLDDEPADRALATIRAATPAEVEVIGTWLWARFDAKPDEQTRELLKAAGWRWSHGKRRWFLIVKPGGRFRRRTTLEELRFRHGSAPVDLSAPGRDDQDERAPL